MSFDILRLPSTSDRLVPVEPRSASLFCLALLACSCALVSLAFACATPFAAFAVVASAMLSMRPALLLMAAAWIVNQGIGFAVLGYPLDAKTALWGVAIGAAALIATLESKVLLKCLHRSGTLKALSVALIGAFAAYEVVLFAVTPFLGGTGSFTLPIIAHLGLLNILWLIGLLAVCAAVRILTATRRHQTMS